MRKDKKAWPVIYTTSTRGSMFRNGSVNPTLYFMVQPDQELMDTDPQYKAYYDDMVSNEIPRAIINKFIVSQPLLVTNDRIPFLLFKSNIDPFSLKEFCRAVVQEFSFHTGKEHSAQYGFDKTMFAQIDKKPSFMTAPMGEKLTRSPLFDEFRQPLELEGEMADQGIICPYSIWKEEKRRQAEAAAKQKEQEEIIEW